jgi:hypothetical protein
MDPKTDEFPADAVEQPFADLIVVGKTGQFYINTGK